MNKASSPREFPDRPIIGVGAVIIDDPGDKVVLVKRGRPPLEGEWSLPGGVVELGETLRAAAEREALEETGLIVEAGEVLEIFDRIVPAPDGRTRYHYVLVDFLCRVRGGKLLRGSDAADVAWAGRNELQQFGLEAPAVGVIEKGFEKIHHGGAEARRKQS